MLSVKHQTNVVDLSIEKSLFEADSRAVRSALAKALLAQEENRKAYEELEIAMRRVLVEAGKRYE